MSETKALDELIAYLGNMQYYGMVNSRDKESLGEFVLRNSEALQQEIAELKKRPKRKACYIYLDDFDFGQATQHKFNSEEARESFVRGYQIEKPDSVEICYGKGDVDNPIISEEDE